MNTSTIIYNVSIVGSLICAWYYFIAPINLSYILVFYSNHSYNFVPLTVLPCCLLTLCSLHYWVRWWAFPPTWIMEVFCYKKLLVRDFGSAPKLSTSKVDVLLVTQIPNIFNLLLSYILIIAYKSVFVKRFITLFWFTYAKFLLKAMCNEFSILFMRDSASRCPTFDKMRDLSIVFICSNIIIDVFVKPVVLVG